MFLENCPKLEDIIQKNVDYRKQEFEDIKITYTPFIKKTIQVFNLSANFLFQNLSSLFSTLLVDKYMGKPLPNGYTENNVNNYSTSIIG
jgi:hypothetical protein